MKFKNKALTALVLFFLTIVITTDVTATYYDNYLDEYSVIEDPLLCTAIDMWGCEIPPENAIYGELYTHDIFTVQVPSVDPWINVTGINQTGNFSILEQGVLDPWTIKITRNGTYMADYSVSFQAPGGASDYHFGISLNGADPENKTHSHRANTAGGDWGVSSLSAIMQLNDGDKIFLQVSDTDAPARDIEIQSANFNAHELQTFQTSQTIIVNQTGGGGSYPGVADDWVNETGDTMSGNLTMGGNWVLDFSTRLGWGNLTGVPTLYSGVADDWVNETGDDMTGDLNTTASISVDETLTVGGHSAFGSAGDIYTVRVLDAAEYISVDSSYNGIVSVLRQMVNNSGGREVLAFNYEVVCDSNITCGGNMAGYRGNSRNRGWAETMRGGYVTVFNERADHNITSAVGLFSVIATRLNNIRGMITVADGMRSHFTLENGTIGNATGFRIIDTNDKTASAQGEILNMVGIKIDDLDSDRHHNSQTFDLGDSINWSRIRGNFTGDQWAELNYVNVTDTAYLVTTIVTDNITVVGKDTHIKGGLSFVESFPDVVAEQEDALGIGVWGAGAGIVGSPDVPRTINLTFVSGTPATCTGFLYVNGTDAFGRYITELFTISVPGFGTVEYETDHAYGNITAIVEDTPAEECIYSIGSTWRFGVSNYPLNDVVDVYKLNADGAHVAEPAAGYEVIPRYGTVNFELIGGLKGNVIIWYRYGVDT